MELTLFKTFKLKGFTMTKLFSALSLFLSLFCLTHLLSATPPRITEELDPETRGPRLFVRGEFQVPPKGETSAPFEITFRTCELTDFQGPDGSLGVISSLRADPKEMKFYIGGARPPETTLEKGYLGVWRPRLLTKNAEGCYTPDTVYTLLSEGRGIGYFGLGRNTPRELIFFGGLLPKYQNRGIMRGTLRYVLNNLLPAFQDHPLTASVCRVEHLEFLITMDAHNPLAREIEERSAPRFFEEHRIRGDIKTVCTGDRPHGELQLRVDLEARNLEREAEKREQDRIAEATAQAALLKLSSAS